MNPIRMIAILTILLLSTLLAAVEETAEKPAITFIELGSNNCIPCKQMKPVMEEIETKFGDRVEVVFYDVWTAEHKKYAEEYGIRVIPTQVFLDANGKEIFRHEGFFPAEDIIELFAKHDVHPLPVEDTGN